MGTLGKLKKKHFFLVSFCVAFISYFLYGAELREEIYIWRTHRLLLNRLLFDANFNWDLEKLEELHPKVKQEFVESALHYLNKKEKDLRIRAIIILGKLNISQEIVILELKKIFHQEKDIQIRQEAVRSLSLLQHYETETLPVLFKALKDSAKEIRLEALYSLYRIYPKFEHHQEKFITAFSECLKGDPDKFMRKRTAHIMGMLKLSSAIPHLLAALNDPSPDVQNYADEALYRIGGATPKEIPALIPLLKNSNPILYQKTLDILADIMSGITKAELESLLALFKISNGKLQKDILKLMSQGCPLEKELLLSLIENIECSPQEVQLELVNTLGKVVDPISIPFLISSLENSNWSIRAKAAWALGQFQEQKNIPVLLKKLKDKNAYVRQNVALALREIGPKQENLAEIEWALNQDQDKNVRKMLIKVILRAKGIR